MMQRRWLWGLVLLMMVGSAGLVLFKPAPYRLAFDPAVLAARETEMWRAYYDGRHERVAVELVATLREQFGLSYVVSALAARDFAEAAARFRQSQSDYETRVLPPLERGYDRIRRATRADWRARDVARAELAWWVARRTPGQWNNEFVGDAIGHLYQLLYGIDGASAEKAGQLRARAAEVRFVGAYTGGVDWGKVQALLTDSYRELRHAIDGRTPS